MDARGVLDPAPSAKLTGGRGRHRDSDLDDPNSSVARVSGRIANPSNKLRRVVSGSPFSRSDTPAPAVNGPNH